MDVITDIVLISFVAAQGAVVFATAYVGLNVVRKSGWPAKIAAMAISYVAWISLTVGGYGLLGGDGGMMDGLLALLAVCLTATVSSTASTLAWLLFARRTA